MKPRYDFSSYTIGLICALPLELRALLLTLDTSHPDLQNQPKNDHNAYQYGRIGAHNVVITSLPKGVTGPSPAAYTTTSMGNTFPNLRFCLFVGIGGGIPKLNGGGKDEADVRLGDVVVGSPVGTYGGVVQFNQGRIGSDGLERTGTLGKPPKVLLNAVARIEARMFNDDGVLLGVMDEMKERLKITVRSGRKIRALDYPGVVGLEDALFRSEYRHVEGGVGCEGCDKGQILERDWGDRMMEDFEPRVHTGTIASGGYVVKDSKMRDELQRLYGAICVETEASGVMDSFPCLVIRGISDYADSHKNDGWQQYAALTAAAYSKLLLQTIQTELINELPSTKGVVHTDHYDLVALLGPQNAQNFTYSPSPSAFSTGLLTPPRQMSQYINTLLSAPSYSPFPSPRSISPLPLLSKAILSRKVHPCSKFATVTLSPRKRNLYFQTVNGRIFESTCEDDSWSTPRFTGLTAKKGTSLAVIAWQGSEVFGEQIRLFYQNDANEVHEWCYTQRAEPSWFPGFSTAAALSPAAENTALAAFTHHASACKLQIRVYFQEAHTNRIREYLHVGGTGWMLGSLSLPLARPGTSLAVTRLVYPCHIPGETRCEPSLFYQRHNGSIWEHRQSLSDWHDYMQWSDPRKTYPTTSIAAFVCLDIGAPKEEYNRVFWQDTDSSIVESREEPQLDWEEEEDGKMVRIEESRSVERARALAGILVQGISQNTGGKGKEVGKVDEVGRIREEGWDLVKVLNENPKEVE